MGVMLLIFNVDCVCVWGGGGGAYDRIASAILANVFSNIRSGPRTSS